MVNLKKHIELPKPSMIIYSVVHKVPQKNMSDINNGAVLAFIKEKDAIYAAKHLNKKVKSYSPDSEYVVNILHVFDKQFYITKN